MQKTFYGEIDMADLKGKEYKKFEDIKHTDDGIEFWYARELQTALG